MPHSSILGGESAATRAGGRDVDLLGPSDTSDSGSDIQGERPMATGADEPDELGSIVVNPDSDSDSTGTGERGAAAGDSGREGGDILPDRIVSGGADMDTETDADTDADIEAAADEPYNADSAEGVDDIADDVDGDDDDDAEKVSPDVASDKGARVFRVPAGTLDLADGE